MNLPNISKEINDYLAGLARSYPVHSLWASRIGDPCYRYLYHSVVDWQATRPLENRVYGIFELGKHLERLGGKLLEEAGWIVQQSPDGYVEKHISGKIDYFISRGELQKIPVEIKWLSNFDCSNWVEMLSSKKRWIRRYPGQIIIYMFLRASRYGLFLAFNKLNAEPTHIWLDFEDSTVIQYCESLLKKAERVWTAIEKRIPPERISPQEGICLDCDFLTTCEPPIYFGEGIKNIEDKNIIQILNRMEMLHANHAEYEALSKERKAILEGIEDAVAGPYLIHGSIVKRKEFTVKASSYWKHKITKLNSLGQPEEIFSDQPVRKIRME